MFRLLSALLAIVLFVPDAAAKPESVAVEVWADTNQVQSLDMSPDAKRVAMLMRRERGADPELLLFNTDDIQGTIKAIEAKDLIPLNVFWVNKDYLVVNFILEFEEDGRPVFLRRTASYNVETEKWTSLVRTTSRRNLRDPLENVFGQLGIGQVVNALRDDPDHVLVSHTEKAGTSPNYYRTNVKTGQRKLVMRGNERFQDFTYDFKGNARGAIEYDAANNRIVTYGRVSADDDWSEIGALNADSRDRFGLIGFFDRTRPHIATIVADEEGENYTKIFEVDIRNGKRELLFGTEGYDAINVIRSPRLSDGSKIVGFTYADEEGFKPYYTDAELAALYDNLEGAFPARTVRIERVSDDGSTVLIRTTGAQDPGSWYLLRDNKVAPIITANPDIPESALSPMKLVKYKARDGKALSGYVTVPEGVEGPVPTIAMPHGGPWVRDTLGYDEWAQLLANQGYAVFQPNYRGSRQLGKEHWIAGDNKWGLEMQDDVEDGMKALVNAGIADPNRLAIFGWSYGGYSAFAAATREDPMFNCMVAGAGVSDLRNIRGGLQGNRFLRRFQKPTISGVSPLDDVRNVTKPMLIVHGDYDQTVPVEHSRWFVEKLEDINADFKYIEIEDMGHSPLEFEQNMQWYPELLNFFETKCGF